MFCPECGAPNEDEAIYCGNCGTALQAGAVDDEGYIEAGAGRAEGEVREPEDVLEPGFDEPELPPPPPRPAVPPPPPRRVPAAQATQPTSGLAIASLLMGIGGLTILPLLGSILAIVFGYMARNDIRQRPHEVSGEGLATAGIVLGWIAVGIGILSILGIAAFTICGLCGAMSSGNF